MKKGLAHCLSFWNLCTGGFLLLGLCVIFLARAAPDEAEERLEKEKALRVVLDRHCQVLSDAQTVQAFFETIERDFPQTETASLRHSCIGAPSGMRCRFKKHGRHSRIYVFYPNSKEGTRSDMMFIVFGLVEDRVVFPTFAMESSNPAQEKP